jgi:predicted  nucleic acid-binding Zn-ribbon protein
MAGGRMSLTERTIDRLTAMRSDRDMTEQAENLILEYLRAMRSDFAQVKQDIRELKLRVSSLENHVANLISDVLRLNGRLDRIDERLDRIEQRLELHA